MRLRLSETNLAPYERELWHFLVGFLPDWGLVKLRQLLQLWLGERVDIGGDRVLLDALPVHISGYLYHLQEEHSQGEEEGSSSTPPFLGGPRLSRLLDERAPCLRNTFQCLRDLVGGHALCPEIHRHAFCIIAPIAPINEIMTTSLQDIDRAPGVFLPSSQGVNTFDQFWLGYSM